MQPTTALQTAIRRLPLTTKQGPHNYYKGNRTGALGRHTKYGGYVLDYKKVRNYVCPDLTKFKLTPFVSNQIEAPKGKFSLNRTGSPMDGKAYVDQWKALGMYNKER